MLSTRPAKYTLLQSDWSIYFIHSIIQFNSIVMLSDFSIHQNLLWTRKDVTQDPRILIAK